MKKFILVVGFFLAGFACFADETTEYDGQCDLPMMMEWLSNMGYVDDEGMPSMEKYEEYLFSLANEDN